MSLGQKPRFPRQDAKVESIRSFHRGYPCARARLRSTLSARPESVIHFGGDDEAREEGTWVE
jgi:hypothetical protein